MVGKPNLPDAGDERPDLKGAAHATPGLAALDQEREASMADEGGASGALVEGEAPPAVVSDLSVGVEDAPSPQGRRLVRPLLAGMALGMAVGVWSYTRRTRTGRELPIDV